MPTPDEPLRENEVGPFGELSARPNPDGLVVLAVPAFEAMLPVIEQRAGRKLTPGKSKPRVSEPRRSSSRRTPRKKWRPPARRADGETS